MIFQTAPLWAMAVALVATAIAAVTDTRTGHIPNWLTLPLVALGPIAHVATGGVPLLLASLAGILLAGLVPYLMFQKGGMQGGDVKLFAALGAWLLPMKGIEAQLVSYLIGAFIALAQLAWNGKLWRTLGNSLALVLNPLRSQAKRREVTPEMMSTLRFGIPIFLATLYVAYDTFGGLLRLP